MNAVGPPCFSDEETDRLLLSFCPQLPPNTYISERIGVFMRDRVPFPQYALFDPYGQWSCTCFSLVSISNRFLRPSFMPDLLFCVFRCVLQSRLASKRETIVLRRRTCW